ncbi:MAG: hypothetical protein HUK15_08910 [Bacteroidales bacterium]|nr:hypothetical protein [Bacteroidales bacterium]
MNKLLILALAVLLLLPSCKNEGTKLVATNIEFSECQIRPRPLTTEMLYHNNTLRFTHNFLPVDCNYQGVIVTPVIDKENRILHIDVDPIVVQADLDDCSCEINVSYEFENFYKKNELYTIIIAENNEEIYRSEEFL